MKRRLRKKKRVGEFQEMGFEIHAKLSADAPEKDIDAFVDRLIDCVEARGLGFGGAVGRARDDDPGGLDGFVTRAGRRSTTEVDRMALDQFLASDPIVVQHDVKTMRDAWYGWA